MTPHQLDLLKQAAHVLAEVTEAKDVRVLTLRGRIVAAIAMEDPAYYGLERK